MPLRALSPILSPRLATVAAAGSTVAIAALDYFTPANLMAGILYGVSLELAGITRDRRFLLGLFVAVEVLNFVMYFAGVPPIASTGWVVLCNRGLVAVILLAITTALLSWINDERVVEAQRTSLAEQNRELEAINEELGQREEEIVRQNEEMQSQTEELERQGEELRVANDELAVREKTLEQLLDLSRSLTAELSHGDMLKKICEALGALTPGLASTVTEKRGDIVHVVCDHGFGHGGLAAKEYPYAGSFTALVISAGQTAYLEDAKLRPDLICPRPAEGEPFRSALAAPLRNQGRCVGTIEVYTRDKHAWTEVEIALVDSIAAQASISLQSVNLVEELRKERHRFEAAFRTAPFGLVAAADAAGQEVYLNPAAALLFGVPVGENVAAHTPAGARLRRNLFGVAGPLPEHRWPLRRALDGEEVSAEELETTLPGGKRHVLLSSAAPVYGAGSRVTGAVWAFADVTALKQLQRELDLRRREAEEASVRKTRFLASVSHDIRTPVNAINLMAEVIRRAVDNPALAPQVPHMAQRLQANSLALVELVTDVLDVARFDVGKVELQESEFALNELLAEEHRQLQPLAADKDLTLDLDLPERPLWVRTDRVKLARVLGNLVGNAVKFTESGAVRLSAALGPERQVLIRVEDTGLGIAPEHQAFIFDEFAQLRNPARDREKGTGLGLAICKRLVEIMGGTISVESTPQRGSTFTVTLPASCVVMRLGGPVTTGGSPTTNGDGAATLRGLRVLLVEDHHPTRESVAEILRNEGATVTEAGDGKSALAALDREQADVLLLDMMLPDLDGREVLRSVRDRRPAGLRAVLVLTGDLTPERLDEVRRLGADVLLGKPIDVNRLITDLRRIPKSHNLLI
jgi:signal transduction histidine kinase/ActR/RegA family two-component response regulator